MLPSHYMDNVRRTSGGNSFSSWLDKILDNEHFFSYTLIEPRRNMNDIQTNPQADFHMLMQIEERAANGLYDCCEDCLNTCIVYKAYNASGGDADFKCERFNPRGGK